MIRTGSIRGSQCKQRQLTRLSFPTTPTQSKMSSGDASKALRDDFSSAAGWGYGSNVPAPSATGSGPSGGSGRQEKDALLLDVFPQEASTDLAGLEQQIRALNMPGVKWGEVGVSPVKARLVRGPAVAT